LGFPVLSNKLGDTIRSLCTLAYPVLDAIQVDAHALFLSTGNGVKEAYALDETAIAGVAAVSYGNMIKRALLGTAT
jgi:hypothetical protein